ncbi:hypothetical protein KC901_02730 [Patescibacteria group bacterium]|nr:hypothetical protein [Patescibacteria group bacterium]
MNKQFELDFNQPPKNEKETITDYEEKYGITEEELKKLEENDHLDPHQNRRQL